MFEMNYKDAAEVEIDFADDFKTPGVASADSSLCVTIH